MIDVIENFLHDEISTYNLNNSIFEDFKDDIKTNRELFDKAIDIDNKVSNYQLDINQFLNKIDKYKYYKCEPSSDSQIVIYTGDPELTIDLLLQSLIRHTKVLLVLDQYMLAINKLFFTIFFNILKNHKINNLIYYTFGINSEIIQDLNNIDREIIIIGDSSLTQLISKNKFYPYRDYILYCDDEKCNDLKDYIFYYTSEAEYELEIIYEDNIEDIIHGVNDSLADTFILLTSNEQLKDKVRKEVKNKKIYINKNPFKEKDDIIKLYI